MAAARLADAWSAARRTISGARAQASRIGDSLRNERTNSEPQMIEAKSKASNEPSMEDILASIRRIIAEDYSAQAAIQGQPAPQPVAQAPAQPVMPQASTDILDLNSRGERFRPPMPEVVAVPPPPAPVPQMPRAAVPNLQTAASAAAQASAAATAQTQGFAARAVSEFSERLGRSFAAAERYQRETTAVQQVAEPASEPVLAREPVTQSAVQAVAAAVQSHLAEAQAAQNLQASVPARAPEPVRMAEPARMAEPPRPVTRQVTMAEPAPVQAAVAQAEPQFAQRPVMPQTRPIAEMRPTSQLQPAASAAPAPAAPAPQPVVQAQPTPVPQPTVVAQPQRAAEPVMQNDPPPAWLLSPKTGTSISGSFKALQEKQPASPVQLTDTQSAALQELVAAALRPMLKDWLDAHLPGMVERMITAEIQRVTRGQ